MYGIKNKLFMRASAIAMTAILIILVTSTRESLNFANAQTSPCDNGTIEHSTHVLPVILVHGYHEGSWMWSNWEHLLSQDHIPFCTVTFHNSDDGCGLASDHATELGQIIQEVKHLTGKGQVNIVAHSKGGLDARVYLGNNRNTNDVANLVMIGTPNGGDPLASSEDNCFAGRDFVINAPATHALPNPHTKYYTIAGNWNPLLASNCPQQWDEEFVLRVGTFLGYENVWYNMLFADGSEFSDGVVPLWSAELHNSTELGPTLDCHSNLLGSVEYNLAKESVLTS
jgi:triacylglycerol lipase